MQPSKPARVRRALIPSTLLKRLVALLLAVASVSPARAEFLPSPEQLALPSEQALFSDMIGQLGKSDLSDSKVVLTVLDATLEKLREPTMLRGFVQFSRAGPLIDLNRNAEALDAIEESIRLLPDFSGPLILAAWTYSYSERPGQGADYLLRASQIDPESARKIDDYEVDNLLMRLRNVRDERRVRAVSERLLEIGWLGTNVSSRSKLALESIRRRMAEGDVAGARALVPKLIVPRHSRTLLVSNAYRDIWPDVEKWTGPMLQRQWSIYLTEVRARWTASQSTDALQYYSQALLAAGHDDATIHQILPRFSQKIDVEEDIELVFVAGGVAGALARKGRWQDVEALYLQAEKLWPLGSNALALNITANRAKWMLFRGSFSDALKLMDAAIADARKWGPEVNSDALAAMHHYRACMLHELGREQEAGVSAALTLAASRPDNSAYLHLCMGNYESARKILITALSNEDTKDDVIGFVQKSDEPPEQSEYGRKSRQRVNALREDPVLLAEVAKHGRVLPYSLNEGAPPEKK